MRLPRRSPDGTATPWTGSAGRNGARAAALPFQRKGGEHVEMVMTRTAPLRFALLVSAALSIAFAQPGAQAPASGAPPRNPLGDPLLESPEHVREDAFYKVPLQPEDRKYADIDGIRMKGVVREAAAISERDKARGTLFWGRNVGFQGHNDTQDWVEGYFRKFGLQNIHRKTFDLQPQWTARSYDISFSSAGQPFTLQSVRPAEDAPSTPAGGSEFDIVWVNTGTAADFVGRDVRGKAVLIQSIPTPGVLRQSINYEGAVDRAVKAGAAAIGMMYGISDNFALWELRTSGKPGFCVGYEDGRRILDRIGKGETVRVRIALQSEERANLKTASVIGSLPGTIDEDIWIVAHMDGYFDGALDNGSGLAVMMGLLEHFSKVPQAERKRRLIFMGSAGHHGGPGARWLHDERETALAKTALIINLEHVSAVRTKYWGPHLRKTNAVAPMRWWVWGGKPLLDIALNSFARFDVGLTADMDTNASGEIGQVARDAPSIQVITSPEPKHTEQDTEEWVPAAGLEQVGRAYARIIDQIDKLPRRDLLPAGAPAAATARR
jgi:hypothetical protein